MEYNSKPVNTTTFEGACSAFFRSFRKATKGFMSSFSAGVNDFSSVANTKYASGKLFARNFILSMSF